MGDFLSDNPILVLIAACEIGFWVVLLAGLAARYLLRARRTGIALLLSVPLIDVLLVVASLVDVGTGRPPGFTHGLAAAYLGFTVAFGHSMIRWADARFAHRFAGGPPPTRPPRHGRERIAYEWRSWGLCVLAWGIALAVLLAVALVAGTGIPAPTAWFADPLWVWGGRLTAVLLIWLAVGPVWATASGPREPAREGSRG